ncbi:MAG TPA: phosphoribosyltransferase family protein [Pyrinomonadaceae bacterium]|nr:phosphoribosyltransferase family protein [Pyrinomonadaceae bacterium]
MVGWGAFDILEDHWKRCHWYTFREKKVSLGELKESYLFGYGAGLGSVSTSSDRVWPFTAVYRTDQGYMLNRVNGEELIAGALRSYARNPIIEEGVAANVFFFEPFENVFQHAFREPSEIDMAVVAMRMTAWMFGPTGELTNQARWLLSKLPPWQKQFIEHHKSPYMEIVLADCGRGIPDSISDSLPTNRSAWESIKYAFEPHSTRKTEPLPGRRGLAWLKQKMAEVHGAIHVESNGANYVMADMGSGLVELPSSPSPAKRIGLGKKIISRGPQLDGTFVHVLFPLKVGPPKRHLPRFPRWRELRDPQSLFTRSRTALIRFQVPFELIGDKPSAEKWDEYLSKIETAIAKDAGILAVLDLNHPNVTRAALEHLFGRFLLRSGLRGRLMAINCDRHLVSRLDTVDSIEQMRESKLIFPLFEATLRMHWVGASVTDETSLLTSFMRGNLQGLKELEELAAANPGYFIHALDEPVDFSFNIDMVESLVRKTIGDSLIESLRARQAMNEGRFVLPNRTAVTTYIEPHQIFADTEIASALCNHLSILLRWRYSRLSETKASDVRVLTATRIGRDIAMRMPATFPARFFVYYDYHLVRPDKPRLVKHLAGKSVVIVVDIISTGSQVNELIKVCEDAGAFVIGIVSFIDFKSEELGHQFSSREIEIEHKTFARLPQILSEPQPGDIPVDKYTLSITPMPDMERERIRDGSALLSLNRCLRMLEDCQVMHHGHYELFGHHYEFVVNMSRLLTLPSPELDEMLRACETAILKGADVSHPTAIVMYPDLSSAHILQGSLEKRLGIRRVLKTRLRFVEARRGSRARGRRYWLTQQELEELRLWTNETYPKGFSVLLLDDGASSGETLLALLDLARELGPNRVAAFVLINRMPHLQTYHHREIERFAWAASNFECLVHLNIPVFSRDSCPMCQERSELAREFRHANEEWFKRQIAARLDRLDLITSLNPQDVPEGPLNALIADPVSESPSSSNLIKGRTIITRAVSLRAAINDGYPIMEVFDEVSQQPDDSLWRLTATELARRVDLQQAQHVERELRDSLIKVIPGESAARGVAALEALRFMRPEVMHPVLRNIVRSALVRDIPGDKKLAELILLMRRVTSYRHLTSTLAFDEESLIEQELDQAGARARHGSKLRSAIDRINYEWQGGPQPRMDLVKVITELEKILQTHRRRSHQLLYELSKYISDQKEVFDPEVRSALDEAVRAATLARMLAKLLADTHKLCDDSLPDLIERAYTNARRLRMTVLSHMGGIELARFDDLRDKMEEIQQDLCVTVGNELSGQIVDPVQAVGPVLDELKSAPPSELVGIDLRVGLQNDLPNGTLIAIDSALFQKIVHNLTSNLRHAIDTGGKRVEGEFFLEFRDNQPGPEANLRVRCATRTWKADEVEHDRTMSAELLHTAEAYGVERIVSEESRQSPESPWEESWSFWRV